MVTPVHAPTVRLPESISEPTQPTELAQNTSAEIPLRTTDYFESFPTVASAPLAFNPADRLFSGLERFDPLTYVLSPQRPMNVLEEYRIMHQARDAQQPGDVDTALKLAEVGPSSLWYAYLEQVLADPSVDAGTRRMAPALLRSVLEAAAGAAATGKEQNNSLRPFQADPSLELLGPVPTGTSHPSGHATLAYAGATLLAKLCPARAEEFYRAAANVARSRVELGVHFAGDVAAGAQLGHRVASDATSMLG